jgi:hypothetical protein
MEADMTVKQNLIAAKALIDTPEKWGKGRPSFTYGDDSLSCTACAHEAVRRIVGTRWDRDQLPECDALKYSLDPKWGTVPDFNDHPFTTHADIMALFDRAIAACED